jgi:hypothetical protein
MSSRVDKSCTIIGQTIRVDFVQLGLSPSLRIENQIGTQKLLSTAPITTTEIF